MSIIAYTIAMKLVRPIVIPERHALVLIMRSVTVQPMISALRLDVLLVVMVSVMQLRT